MVSKISYTLLSAIKSDAGGAVGVIILIDFVAESTPLQLALTNLTS